MKMEHAAKVIALTLARSWGEDTPSVHTWGKAREFALTLRNGGQLDMEPPLNRVSAIVQEYLTGSGDYADHDADAAIAAIATVINEAEGTEL